MLNLNDTNVDVQKGRITAEKAEQEAAAGIGLNVTYKYFHRDSLYVTHVYADELVAELSEKFPSLTKQQLAAGLDCAAAALRGELQEIEDVVWELEDLISQVEEAVWGLEDH